MKLECYFLSSIVILILLATYIFNIVTVKDYNVTQEVVLNLGEEYTAGYPISANTTAELLDGNVPLFTLKVDDKVEVIDQEGMFAKVKYLGDNEEVKEGYILAWFLTEDAKKINENEPYLALVDKAREYSLPLEGAYKYEAASEEEQIFLEEKVAKVIATYGEYSLVSIVRYDSVYYDYTWLKNTDIMPYNSIKVKEGYIKVGAKSYTNEELTIEGDRVDSIIYIQDNGDCYKYYSGGGVEGYIKKNEFIPISSPNDIA